MNTFKCLVLLLFSTIVNAQINTQKLLNEQKTERQALEQQQRASIKKITTERDAKLAPLLAIERALERDNETKLANLRALGIKDGNARMTNQKRANALDKVTLEEKHKKIRKEANAKFNAQNKQLAERFGNKLRLLANTQTPKKKLALKQEDQKKDLQTQTNNKLKNVVLKEAKLQDKLETGTKQAKAVYGATSKAFFQKQREIIQEQYSNLHKLDRERKAILKTDKGQKKTLKKIQKAEKTMVFKHVNERQALMQKQDKQKQELKNKLVKKNIPTAKANKILAKQRKVNQRPIKELNKKQAKEIKKFNKKVKAAQVHKKSAANSKTLKKIKRTKKRNKNLKH